MGKVEDLRFLVRALMQERVAAAEVPAMVPQLPDLACVDALDDPAELFRLFRTLVNIRPPLPASEEFLNVQDRVLRGRIAEIGVTQVQELPRVPLDSRLSLWRGDITTLAADVVVNAANSQMLGCWVPGHHCIDNAIHTFAGVQLRRACFEFMQAQGHEEPTGQAKVTLAYNLPARYIIHTVGPVANGRPTQRDCVLLAQSYTRCLEVACKHGCASIAFCCISTGVFGFPQVQAASIAVAAVRRWLDACDANMHVVFNVFTQTDEEIYHGLLGT